MPRFVKEWWDRPRYVMFLLQVVKKKIGVLSNRRKTNPKFENEPNPNESFIFKPKSNRKWTNDLIFKRTQNKNEKASPETNELESKLWCFVDTSIRYTFIVMSQHDIFMFWVWNFLRSPTKTSWRMMILLFGLAIKKKFLRQAHSKTRMNHSSIRARIWIIFWKLKMNNNELCLAICDVDGWFVWLSQWIFSIMIFRRCFVFVFVVIFISYIVFVVSFLFKFAHGCRVAISHVFQTNHTILFSLCAPKLSPFCVFF